jgi:hypothetical protein
MRQGGRGAALGVDAATFAARFGLVESEKGKGRGGTVWGRMPREGGKERGGANTARSQAAVAGRW